MPVLVRIPLAFRGATGGRAEVLAAAPTVADLALELGRQFPALRDRLLDEAGELRRFITWYVNEEDVRFVAGKATPLADGDHVTLVPAIAGGGAPGDGGGDGTTTMSALRTVSPFFSSYENQTSIYTHPPRYDRPLGEIVQHLTLSRNIGRYFLEHAAELDTLLAVVAATCRAAYEDGDAPSVRQVQQALFNIYEQFVAHPVPGCEMNGLSWVIARVKTAIEEAWISHELRRARAIAADGAASAGGLAEAIRYAIRSHPSHDHEIFAFLQHEASQAEIHHYFVCDYPLNVKFYDLVALSLVGSDPVTRIEVASNFWDEVGRGDASKTHLQLYSNVLLELGLDTCPQTIAARMSSAALAGYNMLLYLAINRDQYFRLIGAMAVTELADPEQYTKLLEGCRRVGLTQAPGDLLAFYEEHVEIDSTHGDGWVGNVIVPIVEKYPASRAPILEGCYFRLNTAHDYWNALMQELRGRRAVAAGPTGVLA